MTLVQSTQNHIAINALCALAMCVVMTSDSRFSMACDPESESISTHIWPRPDMVSFPTNSPILFRAVLGNGPLTHSLIGPNGEVPVERTDFEYFGASWIQLQPLELLEPETDYTFKATLTSDRDTVIDVAERRFKTGEGPFLGSPPTLDGLRSYHLDDNDDNDCIPPFDARTIAVVDEPLQQMPRRYTIEVFHEASEGDPVPFPSGTFFSLRYRDLEGLGFIRISTFSRDLDVPPCFRLTIADFQGRSVTSEIICDHTCLEGPGYDLPQDPSEWDALRGCTTGQPTPDPMVEPEPDPSSPPLDDPAIEPEPAAPSQPLNERRSTEGSCAVGHSGRSKAPPFGLLALIGLSWLALRP